MTKNKKIVLGVALLAVIAVVFFWMRRKKQVVATNPAILPASQLSSAPVGGLKPALTGLVTSGATAGINKIAANFGF